MKYGFIGLNDVIVTVVHVAKPSRTDSSQDSGQFRTYKV